MEDPPEYEIIIDREILDDLPLIYQALVNVLLREGKIQITNGKLRL